jgi:hypothetical protein
MHILKCWRSMMLIGALGMLAPGCGLEAIDDGGDEGDAIPPAVQQAFDESCATSVGCHAAGAGQVVLAAPESVQILTASSGSGGGPFVTLGDLEASYIAQKILGGPNIAGGKMPPSTQSPNDAMNQQIIIDWIADDSDPGDGDGDGDGDPGPICYIEFPIPAMPSFETDIWPIFETRCGVGGCHADSSPPLMPDAMTAYDNLVGAAAGAAALDLVEPLSADDSYLWHKLMGTQATIMGGAGATMPFGGSLCPIEMQAVYAWINSGAEL